MDVERTVEFILDQQAQAAAKIQELATKMEELAERQNRTEIQIQALAQEQQVLVGIVRAQQGQIESVLTAVAALTESQRALNQRVDSLARMFEEWLRRSGDGSGPR